MTARALLEMLQRDRMRPGEAPQLYEERSRALYIEMMAHYDAATRELLESNLRKQDARHARYAPRTPTPYQSLQDFSRLIDAKKRIDVTLEEVGEYQPSRNLVIGSVESEHLNAMSTYCADSAEFLIVFNRGLLMALLQASNYVIAALMPDLDVGQDDPFKSDRPLEQIDQTVVEHMAPRFRELLQAVSEYRLPDPRLTLPMFQHRRWELRWTMIEDFVTDFVFAHEYVHVLRGHLSVADPPRLSEDQGGWGREYEADSLALDFVVQTWMRKLEGNPVGLTFILQGVCLFFTFLCQVERFSAQVLGKSALVWRSDKTHPPTLIRFMRMLSKAREKSHVPWTFVTAQLGSIYHCLELYYSKAIDQTTPGSAPAIEWRFQRTAFENMVTFELVPQHLFIAARCARAALDRHAVLDGMALVACAAEADRVLEASGARPLQDYQQPLERVARTLAEQVLIDCQSVGVDVVRGFVDRLAAVFLLDARTRYPASSV